MLEMYYDPERFLSPEMLPQTIGFIEDALAYTFKESSVSSILDSVRCADLALLSFVDNGKYVGCVTGKTVHYPEKDVFRVITMGGITMNYWKEAGRMIEDFARCLTCDAVEIWCRPDAVRAGKDFFGLTHQYSVMVKEV